MPERKIVPSSWRYLASRAKSGVLAIVPLESALRGVTSTAAVDVHDTDASEGTQLSGVMSPRARDRPGEPHARVEAASPGDEHSAGPSSPARSRAGRALR